MLAHAHCRQPHIGTGAMGGRGCKVDRLMCKIETGLAKGDNIMARFGMHLSIAGGFTNATSRAVELGCDCFQIFSRNPRTLRAKPIDRGAADAFRSAVAQAGLKPVVVHVNYLVNVASPKDETYEASVSALTDELLRAEILGADYLVLHPGNHLGSGVEAGSERIARAIDRAYEHSGSSVMISLENMAGAGTEIGVSFGELRSICDLSERGKSLGICFDTCHAYGAGYDVSTDRGLDRTLGELDAEIGLDRLMFVHANDSKGQLGAARDRHEHIGEGLIGVAGFRAILRRKELRDLHFILKRLLIPRRSGSRFGCLGRLQVKAIEGQSTCRGGFHSLPRRRRSLRQAIEQAGATEVFAVGRCDRNFIVTDVSVLARGNLTAAPVVDSTLIRGQVVIHNHPSGELLPSDADLAVASMLASRGIGFWIVNNDVSALRSVTDPLANEAGSIVIDPADIRHVFSSEGPLSAGFKGYEMRQGQIDMALAVSSAFQNRPILLWSRDGNRQVSGLPHSRLSLG